MRTNRLNAIQTCLSTAALAWASAAAAQEMTAKPAADAAPAVGDITVTKIAKNCRFINTEKGIREYLSIRGGLPRSG